MVTPMHFKTDFGVFVACAMHRTDPRDFMTIKAAQEVIDNDFEELGRFTAKMTYNMLKNAGHEFSVGCQYMKLISEQTEWIPQYNEPCHIVLELVEKHASILNQQAKVAGAGGALFGLSSNAVQMAVALSLLGGAGVGSAYWGLERNKDEDVVDIEKLQAQVGVYQDLANETKSKLDHKYQHAAKEAIPA